MKLSDVIIEATKNDIPTEITAEDIIGAAARTEIKRTRAVYRKAIPCTVLIILLLTASVSAIFIAQGGFKAYFGINYDVGNVPEATVIGESGDDVKFRFTEAWYDDYNIFIGGVVETPEPLPLGHEYFSIANCVFNGMEFSCYAAIYPSGERECDFILLPQAWLQRDKGVYFTDESIAVELSMNIIGRMIGIDEAGEQAEGPPPLYNGEWKYNLEVTRDTDYISAEGPFTAGNITVHSVKVNRFTYTVNCTGNYKYDEYLSGDTGETERRKSSYMFWLKRDDGTYIGKSSGVGYDPDVDNYGGRRGESREDFECMTYIKPLELSRIVSMVIVDEWYTYPDENGEIIEVFNVILEIPLS